VLNENQISCSVCGKLFTPTRSHQKKCKNLCNVIIYNHREKVRALLMLLHTPSQLVALELFAETLIDEAT